MDSLDRHNAAVLARWSADIDSMLGLCQCGAVVGNAEEQTAFIHALFWKKWWAYVS